MRHSHLNFALVDQNKLLPEWEGVTIPSVGIQTSSDLMFVSLHIDSPHQIMFIASCAGEMPWYFQKVASLVQFFWKDVTFARNAVGYLCGVVWFFAWDVVDELLQLLDVASQFCGLDFVEACAFLLQLIQGHVLGECGQEIECDFEGDDKFLGLYVDEVEFAWVGREVHDIFF